MDQIFGNTPNIIVLRLPTVIQKATGDIILKGNWENMIYEDNTEDWPLNPLTDISNR